jgi:hypothetical protein
MLAEQAALADQKEKKSACLTRNEIRIAAAPIALIEGGGGIRIDCEAQNLAWRFRAGAGIRRIGRARARARSVRSKAKRSRAIPEAGGKLIGAWEGKAREGEGWSSTHGGRRGRGGRSCRSDPTLGGWVDRSTEAAGGIGRSPLSVCLSVSVCVSLSAWASVKYNRKGRWGERGNGEGGGWVTGREREEELVGERKREGIYWTQPGPDLTGPTAVATVLGCC